MKKRTSAGRSATSDSFLRSCFIKPRPNSENDPMFVVSRFGTRIIARLDGYAIIPMEEYKALTAKTGAV